MSHANFHQSTFHKSNFNNLTFKQLGIKKDDRYILHHCQGQLESGQRIALVGESGSGKSVLLRVLAGLMPYDTGSVCLDDTLQGRYSPVLWRSTVRLMPQDAIMIEGSVLTNLKLPYQFRHIQQLPKPIATFNKQWHLTQLKKLNKPATFLQQDATQLSGGEKQLVNLLRYLQLNPSILLLDEPTSALDATSTNLFEQMVDDWITKNPQHAYIWITHDENQAKRIGQQQWHMQQGKLSKPPPPS